MTRHYAAVFLFVMTGMATEHRDDSGFSVNVPDGWQVRKYDGGAVTIQGPSPSKFVLVLPILGRTKDCATSLRMNLTGSWPVFPAVSDLAIEPGNRSAVARFLFHNRQSRGAVLCAETSNRTGMIYGIAAPAQEFAREQPVMTDILRSFKYGGTAASSAGAPAAALPRMTKWREQNEGAFVIPIPEGWHVQGGIRRISNTDVRGGIRVWSPDGASLIQFNDVRLDKVLVPGRQGMPAAQLGAGWRAGPHQSGLQMAEWYLRQIWTSELSLSGLTIVSRQDRPDLSSQADQVPRSMGVHGFQHLFGEVSFRATRNGRPVEGRLLGMTRMLWSQSPDLLGGNFETEIKGYMGPAGSGGTLARIGGYMEGNCEHNYQWVAANRQAAAQDVRNTLNQMHASAEMQQKAFWDRMAASDQRREAVNDVLGGRVRLTDGQGNQYEAKAGSNYYFYDVQAGRTAGRPNDAVVGADVYPAPIVDLRPLEVLR
ncbi:hypothetical protein [uncultured Paludibaculum sp.]|uniref:hypothetical protein n=1 Tax=uncultured Paludibaculum sp. TaxID=1765020 RepID=UPI002AAACC06|nr:hypothetical protein [uncultured Paludibaculum sp.]